MSTTTLSPTLQIKRTHFAAVIVGVAALGASLSLTVRVALDHDQASSSRQGSHYVDEVTSMTATSRAATYGNVVDHATAVAWMPDARLAAAYGNVVTSPTGA